MTPEKIAELDASAAERAGTLGKQHVHDGPQFYHAGALQANDHVAGSEAVGAIPDQVATPELTGTEGEGVDGNA